MIKEQKGQCSDENTAQKTQEIKCAKFKRASMHIDRTTPISKTTPRLTTPKTTVTTTIATTTTTTTTTSATCRWKTNYVLPMGYLVGYFAFCPWVTRCKKAGVAYKGPKTQQ